MGRRRLTFLILLVLAAIFVWQLPSLLKAIPSRYVAAYLPQPVQALAVRDHVETLPTAAVVVDAESLLLGVERVSSQVINSPTPTVEATSVPSSAATAERMPTVALSTSSDETPVAETVQPSPTPAPTSTPIPIPASARLPNFRHHFQTWNNCGPATLAMGLSHFDLLLGQEQTAEALKPNPEDRNVSPHEMAAFVNQETNLSALTRANGSLESLKRLIAAGFPVIVELGIDPPGEYRWMGWYGHYLLVVAYDDSRSTAWVYDSWFGTSETPGENADADGREVRYDDLDIYWRQFSRNYIVLYEPDQADEVAAIIGEAMNDETMWKKALAQTQTEVSAEPGNAFLWFNLGTVYNELGDYEKAAVAFDEARSIGLPWRMLWYQFGPYEAYYQSGRFEDIVLLTDLTLKDRPYFEESYYYRGLAQAALGNARQARADLEHAVRFNPNYAPAAEALEQLEA